MAVGSQANTGGVSTTPEVVSIFHPALAPVGVLLAVLSHVLGTYSGLLTAWIMRLVEGEKQTNLPSYWFMFFYY